MLGLVGIGVSNRIHVLIGVGVSTDCHVLVGVGVTTYRKGRVVHLLCICIKSGGYIYCRYGIRLNDLCFFGLLLWICI